MTAWAQKGKLQQQKRTMGEEQVTMIEPDNQLGLEEYQKKAEGVQDDLNEEKLPETQLVSTQEVAQEAEAGLVPTPLRQRSPAKKYLEGMTMTELKNSVHEEFCNHCKMALTGDPRQRVVKKSSATKICRQCHNTVTLLYKNVDVAKLGWSEVPADKMKAFFREAKSIAAESSGRLSFSKLKTVVEQTLIESEKMLTATRIQGKFLPLSVWKQKGFDTARIMATAEKRDSAMLLGFQKIKYVYHNVLMKSKDCKTVMTELHGTNSFYKDYKTLIRIPIYKV